MRTIVKIYRQIIIILIFTIILFSMVQANVHNEKQFVIKQNDGYTLYVGGSGPGNYSRIQDAIDNATDGDTIYVFNGTYNENIVINKSISLLGEDKDRVYIDGNKSKYTISINPGINGVLITNFNLINSKIDSEDITIKICSNSSYNKIIDNIINNRLGINIEPYSQRNEISNNTIFCQTYGIYLKYSNGNLIKGNTISTDLYDTIVLENSSNNSIIENKIRDNLYGILITHSSNYNIISKNDITNNLWWGIDCGGSTNNRIYENVISNNGEIGINLDSEINIKIYRNNITNNGIGLGMAYSPDSNQIYENNFINNEIDAGWQMNFFEYIRYFSSRNVWDKNYWNESRVTPKPIPGFLYLIAIGNLPILIPWVYFDWHPAQEPYDI